MPVPVSVVLDRVSGLGTLDLSGIVAEDSLTWSSVVPGGFASCSFTAQGDFRTILKQIPYLSTLRVIGDSGRVLWEGQIEDLSPTVSEGELGVKVGAFGMQNALKERTVRKAWSIRDLALEERPSPFATLAEPALFMDIGQFDETNQSRVGVLLQGVGGVSLPLNAARFARYWIPPGLTILRVLSTVTRGTSGTTNITIIGSSADTSGTFTPYDFSSTAVLTNSAQTWTPKANAVQLIFGAQNTGAAFTPTASDFFEFENIRLLGVLTAEDTAGGFFGDTLIKSLLTFVPTLGPGVIESGSDFTIDHLDASVRRTAYDILTEIASYYSREWAVWENGLLDWETPQLSQPQWIIPIAQLSSLDLDASVQNSKKTSYVLYTDAASGLTAEASVTATDRRNPYVLNGRAKDEISPAELTMTANTSAQLAAIILNDLGFGPVPAAGSISLPGDSIVQHAQGNAVKAWEIRSGDNVTIPELPMADVFTQDGRGEALFHVVSAEAEIGTGLVTLTLDSYGSKRSDVLIARLAAVTAALGG